jgi:flagellin-like protein
MRTSRESAVSEIIGVILIVALTVILAAIVAAYMFGMLPSLPSPRTIALTASQQDSDHIMVVYHGGPDQKSLASMNITWPSGVVQLVTGPKIGDTYIATNVGVGPRNVTSGKDHLVISGTFTNNVQQVVLDTFV